MMVMLGTDAHKRSHTIVAVDPAGAEIGSLTVAATTDGHRRAVQWAGQFDERRWAIEDCRALSRRLERLIEGPRLRDARGPSTSASRRAKRRTPADMSKSTASAATTRAGPEL